MEWSKARGNNNFPSIWKEYKSGSDIYYLGAIKLGTLGAIGGGIGFLIGVYLDWRRCLTAGASLGFFGLLAALVYISQNSWKNNRFNPENFWKN